MKKDLRQHMQKFGDWEFLKYEDGFEAVGRYAPTGWEHVYPTHPRMSAKIVDHFPIVENKECPVAVTQIFKAGEKVAGRWSKRGRKPQGYNIYIEDAWYCFIPYERTTSL